MKVMFPRSKCLFILDASASTLETIKVKKEKQ